MPVCTDLRACKDALRGTRPAQTPWILQWSLCGRCTISTNICAPLFALNPPPKKDPKKKKKKKKKALATSYRRDHCEDRVPHVRLSSLARGEAMPSNTTSAGHAAQSSLRGPFSGWCCTGDYCGVVAHRETSQSDAERRQWTRQMGHSLPSTNPCALASRSSHLIPLTQPKQWSY